MSTCNFIPNIIPLVFHKLSSSFFLVCNIFNLHILILQGREGHLYSAIIISIIILGTLAFYTYGNSSELSETTLESRSIIEYLRGDAIDTWKSWFLVEDKALTITIINSELVSQEKIKAIKDSILSEESIEIDDSLQHKGPVGSTSVYYMGWKGALEQASKQNTQFNIPSEFNIIESSKGVPDIIIHLTNLKDRTGDYGYANLITDGNQILKATITIYNVDSLSSENLATITRHEFGHALGLGHSTAPEDLMAPLISTSYPYISECDVDAVVSLYDNKKSSQVICEK